MRHTASVFLVLAVLWLVNSGNFSGLLLGFGLLSVLLVVFLSRRMNIIDEESQPFHLGRRLPGYYAWLLWKIVQGSVDVALRAWRGNGSVDPQLRMLPVDHRTDLGRVIYANSMTLTPGTVAVDLREHFVLVHSLTPESMADLHEGMMARRVRRLEA